MTSRNTSNPDASTDFSSEGPSLESGDFDVREFARTARGTHRGALDLEAITASGLGADAIRLLRLLRDLERTTMQRMRNLLVTATHKDARVTAFLTTWAYEKYWLADALDAVLEATGDDLHSSAPAGGLRRLVKERQERRGPVRRAIQGMFDGPQIVAAHVTTGLVDEWITQAAYRRLGELATELHSVVTMVVEIKDRHIRFLSEEAHRRLNASARAIQLTQRELTQSVWPIGAVERSDDDRSFFERVVFGTDNGRAEAHQIEQSVAALPGLPVRRPDHFCETHSVTPKRATTDLGRAHVFLTGATGFVGQAVLERLLSSHPETTISILVRTKAGDDVAARIAELLAKPVFQSWRDKVGDAAVAKAAKERIRIVEGAMGSIPALPKDLDVAIHSASVVSFDPPIDEAFNTNVNGAINLYERLLEAGGDPRVVHVSTCYVGGLRKGVAPEARLTHEVDWRAEYTAALAARDRVELLSRESDQLRVFMDAARAKHGKEGPQAVAKASEEARLAWVKAELVDAGRTRAQSLGWTDVYTLTKAFSERAAEELWGENGHRLSIVRPAIIESALKHPYPGWIDGFKVADPLIVAYGRGLLPEFPGLPDSILDVIPVDYVVNAILAAAANPAAKNEPDYYHVASGASNPLPFHQEFGYVNRYFLEHPMKDKKGADLVVPTWKFPVSNKVDRGVARQERLVATAEKVLGRLPDTERVRRWHNQMIRNAADLKTLRNFNQLYLVYVQTEIIFDDRKLRALHDALPAAKKADFGFDIAAIDWGDYMMNVHFPAVVALTTEFSAKRAAKKAAEAAAAPTSGELAPASNVLAVFDLEGTVVDSNIVQQYLWVRSAGLRKAAWPGEVLSILGSLRGYLRAERRDRGEFIRSFLRRYEGMPVARLEKIVRGGYAETMYRHTSPEAIARIKAHREAGHRTVLVTGSIETLAEPLAGLFDEVVGGHMHDHDGVLTGYLAKPPLVDEARAAWVRRYAEEHGLDLATSHGYGDSHADLVWLELLGNPHAVNPDTQLAREAQRRKWRSTPGSAAIVHRNVM